LLQGFSSSSFFILEAIASGRKERMKQRNQLKSAQMGAVNSVFVNIEAGVVIGLDDDSIRIWDPVKGVELQVFDTKNGEDQILTAVGSMYRFV